MEKSILIATAQTELNELLRLNLEEGTDFQISFAQSSEEALKLASEKSFPLAILDAELPEQPFPMFFNALSNKVPGIRSIVLPPENNPEHPLIDGIEIEHFLSRPFFKQDLIDLVEKLLGESQVNPEGPGEVPVSESDSASFEDELATLINKGEFSSNIEETQPSLTIIKEGAPETAADKLLQNMADEQSMKSLEEQDLDMSLDDELEKLLSEAHSPLSKDTGPDQSLPETEEAASEENDSLLEEVMAQINGQAVETPTEIPYLGEPSGEIPGLSGQDEEEQGDDVLESVMAQLDSQAVEETTDISEDDIVIQPAVTETPDDDEDNDVLESVMAQLDSQAVEETTDISEDDFVIQPVQTETSDEDEDIDVLESVMAQLDSQTLDESAEISEDDIVIEETTTPEPVAESSEKDVLEAVISQLESQAVEESADISAEDIHIEEQTPLAEDDAEIEMHTLQDSEPEVPITSEDLVDTLSRSIDELGETGDLPENMEVESGEDLVDLLAEIEEQEDTITAPVEESQPEIASDLEPAIKTESSFSEMLESADSVDADEQKDMESPIDEVLSKVKNQLKNQSTDEVEILGDSDLDQIIKLEEEPILDITLFDPQIIESIFRKNIHQLSDQLQNNQNQIPSIAVLIVKSHQILARAGFIPQQDIRQLVDALSQTAGHEKQNDLVKYIRFSSNNNEYILFGTPLGNDFFLGTVNDSLIPVSEIRKFTQTLSKRLVEPLPIQVVPTEIDSLQQEEEVKTTSLQDLLASIPDEIDDKDVERGSGTWISEEFSSESDHPTDAPSILDVILEESKDDEYLKSKDWSLDISKDVSLETDDIFEGYDDGEIGDQEDEKLSDEEFKEILNTMDDGFEDSSGLTAAADLLAKETGNLELPGETEDEDIIALPEIPQNEFSAMLENMTFEEDVPEETPEEPLSGMDFEFERKIPSESLLEEDRNLLAEMDGEELEPAEVRTSSYDGFQSVLALAQEDPSNGSDDIASELTPIESLTEVSDATDFEKQFSDLAEAEAIPEEESIDDQEEVKPHWADTVARLKELTFDETLESVEDDLSPDLQETIKIPEKPTEFDGIPSNEISAQLLQSTIQDKIKKYDDQDKDEEQSRFVEDSILKIIEEDEAAEDDLVSWVNRNVPETNDKSTQIDLEEDFKLPWEENGSDEENITEPDAPAEDKGFSRDGFMEEESEAIRDEFPTQPVKSFPPPETRSEKPSKSKTRKSKRGKKVCSCVLIPQLENKSLSIDLAKKLAKQLPKIAKSSGSKLLDVKIKPKFMLWTIELPASFTSEKMVHVFRQQTTRIIYSEVPSLKDIILAGDFWAKDVLLVDDETPTNQEIKDFIIKARSNQDTNPFIK